MTSRLACTWLVVAVFAASPASAESVSDIVLDRAQRDAPAHLAAVKVTAPASLSDLDVDAGDVTVDWRKGLKVGTQTVRVSVRIGDDTQRGWVKLTVYERKEVLVAARALERGATVAQGDLVIEERPVARDEGWLLLPEPLVGAEILADVAAGTIIGGNHVAELQPLAKGTEVSVVVHKGRITISSPGTLERSAQLGSIASVKITALNRVVKGRLMDAQTIVVEAGDDQ